MGLSEASVGELYGFFSTQLLLQRAPNEIRGRIFGTEFALFTLMGSIGTAVVGALLDQFHVRAISLGNGGTPASSDGAMVVMAGPLQARAIEIADLFVQPEPNTR